MEVSLMTAEMKAAYNEYVDALKELAAAERMFNATIEEAKKALQPNQERFQKALQKMNQTALKDPND